MADRPHPKKLHNRSVGAQGPILVVDDEVEVLWLIRQLLEEKGFTVETAVDAEEALARAEESQPALVILDLGLPSVAGETLAARLRHSYGNDLPILVVSGHSRTSDRVRLAGGFGYLPKPFDPDELLKYVRQALGKQIP